MTTDLRSSTLEVIQALPKGGGYKWPADDPKAGGCLADIVHDGGRVLKAAPPSTFCSGLTLDVWFRAWRHQARVPPITFKEAQAIQRMWFITRPEYRRGPVDALIEHKLGEDSTHDPKPGDFAQIWRRNGSGHTVVVLDYDKQKNTLRYFSTQSTTNGLGEKTETPHEMYSVKPMFRA